MALDLNFNSSPISGFPARSSPISALQLYLNLVSVYVMNLVSVYVMNLVSVYVIAFIAL